MYPLSDLVVTVTPLIGYLSQLRLIRANNCVGSFSIDVCAILLIANILRIVFWFTNGFAINLLVQSFLIIAIQVHIKNISAFHSKIMHFAGVQKGKLNRH